MGLHQPDKGHWLSGDLPSRQLTGFLVALAFPAAAIALLLPGQVGELAGIASILLLGGLAAAAGHRWGLAVILFADVALAANVWPLVNAADTFGRHWTLAVAGLGLAVPGVVLLARVLPEALGGLLGISSYARRRAVAAFASVGLIAWLAAPTLSGAGFQVKPTAASNPVVNASVSDSMAKSSSPVPAENAKRLPALTSPMDTNPASLPSRAATSPARSGE